MAAASDNVSLGSPKGSREGRPSVADEQQRWTRRQEHHQAAAAAQRASESGHGTWCALLPSQIAESEDGEEVCALSNPQPLLTCVAERCRPSHILQVGFLYPSGGIGGGASHCTHASFCKETDMQAASASGGHTLAFVPVTDVRTVGDGGWLDYCGCGGEAQRVLIRYEVTSLPPGVQSIEAARARGTRHAPVGMPVGVSFTADRGGASTVKHAT